MSTNMLNREDAVYLVVGHCYHLDADPRSQSLQDVLNGIEESHHWDALDNGESAEELTTGDNAQQLKVALDQYCAVQEFLESDTPPEQQPLAMKHLRAEFHDAETKFRDTAVSSMLKYDQESSTYSGNISYVKTAFTDEPVSFSNPAKPEPCMQTPELRTWHDRIKQSEPLSDSERKDLGNTLENSLTAPRALHDAQALTALWARKDGPGQEKHLSSKHLKDIYQVESQPVTPPENDKRMQSCVVAGKTVYRSAEYDHRARANVIEGNQLGRETSAKRLDIVHESGGISDKFSVQEVSLKAQTPYSSGRLSSSKEVSREPVQTFNTFAKAADYADQKSGKKPQETASPTISDRASMPRPKG